MSLDLLPLDDLIAAIKARCQSAVVIYQMPRRSRDLSGYTSKGSAAEVIGLLEMTKAEIIQSVIRDPDRYSDEEEED